MSRNFELLSQLDADLDVVPKNAKANATADRAERAHRTEPSDSFNRELLSLAQSVFFSNRQNSPHVVVLCGVEAGSGSSEICAQLGRMLSSLNPKPVCIIDADLRSQRLSTLLGGHRAPSLPAPVQGSCQLAEDNLWITTPRLLNQNGKRALAPAHDIREQVRELRSSFDLILIDAPGVNTGADAAVLAQFADAAILVIEANSTHKAAALKAKKTLEAVNVRLLGSVLNNRSFPIPERLYRKI